MAKLNHKYIFVVGGVMSGVGKGVSTASIGRILQGRGYRVTMVKCDMYVNIDAGTMRPTEHGEVFVGEDGIEADQDLGNYERFADITATRDNYVTTGQVYQAVIDRERSLGYGGEDVEVVPDIPNEIIRRIDTAARKAKAEVVVVEIGGTVGEYQNILFLEAIRILKLKYPNDVALVLVSYLPIPKSIGEMKTKPTQYAARTLNAAGLQCDFILCRAERPIDGIRRKRLAVFCGIEPDNAISAPDVESIYEIPVNFEKEHLSDKLLKKLQLKPRRRDLRSWQQLVRKIRSSMTPLKIGIVGKYFGSGNFTLADSYISVIEAVKHAAYGMMRRPVIEWLDAEEYEKNPKKLQELLKYDGIIIPGGFGSRGVEGKIAAIRFCREKKIPYLGLCYGMQLAVIEFARDVLGLKKANTTEVNRKTPDPVIDIMPEQKKNLAEKNYGATMRLGAYPAVLKANSIAHMAYSNSRFGANDKRKLHKPRAIRPLLISERHRHRYEVNPDYIKKLEKKGMVFSGISPDRRLMEIMELPRNVHPFFLGTQFHPEFKSRPLHPHPLYVEFVKVAAARKNPKS